MAEMQREQIALFRYGVIGPLISGELVHGERNTMIRELASRRYNIPNSTRTTIAFGTIEEWLYKYRNFGFESLKPSIRNDKGRIRHMRPQLKKELLDMREKNPKMPVKIIMKHLVEQKKMTPGEISRNTIYRMFAKETTKRTASKTGKVQKRFVHRYANQCWQGDVMYGPYIKETPATPAKRTYLISYIDDASRLIVQSRFYYSESTANIKTVLRDAVLTYGVPSKLYLDNGRNFAAEDIRIACASMHTALIHSTPYYPEGKGKIERFHKTVRSSFLSSLKPISSIRTLNQLYDTWLQNDYNRAEHGALEKDMTPLKTWMKKIEGRLRHLPRHVDPEELFFRKETRLVLKDGTFRINNILYEAEEQLIGKKITVCYDRDDQTQKVKVYNGNCFVHEATPVDYIANAHTKRKDIQS